MAKKVCVICGKESEGHPVQDDAILSMLRKIKEKLRMAQGNILVVCEKDLEKARQKRARFEKYLMWYGLLAAAVFFIIVFSSSSLLSFIAGVLAALFVLSLSIMAYYPNVSVNPRKPEAKTPRAKKKPAKPRKRKR